MNLKHVVALGLTIFSFSSMAVSASLSKAEFCSDRKDKDYVKELALENEGNMSFTNHGGIANGGVCWWHSRFVRKALYLTYYKPELPAPTVDEAVKIIEKIRSGNEVIAIPGVSNFREFSRQYSALIQAELENWQIVDGFIKQSWIVGLSGSHEVKPKNLKKKMDELYNYVVKENNIAYEKLQIKGITAHAWLVVDMKKVKGGYDLFIIDSNYYNYPIEYNYRDGDTSFTHPFYGNFVPYLEQKGEMKKIKKVISKYCM